MLQVTPSAPSRRWKGRRCTGCRDRSDAAAGLPAPRRHTAISNASVTGCAVMWCCMDQPDDASRKQIEHDRDVQPAFGGPNVRKVGDPFLVRAVGGELAIQYMRTPGPRTGGCSVAGDRASSGTRSQGWARASTGRPAAGRTRAPTRGRHRTCAGRRTCESETTKLVRMVSKMAASVRAREAGRRRHPRIEPTARDTERLAQHVHRPGPSVLHHLKPNLTSTPSRSRPRLS